MDVANTDESIKDLWATDNRIIGKYLSEKLTSDPEETPGSTELQLRRFVHHQKDIRCLKYLGGGEDGVVVLAEIEGNTYALKVFKVFKFVGDPVTSEKTAIYETPLANESRAFARLESIKQIGTFAIKCHGWMKLSDGQFETINQVAVLDSCTRWVIVKEYISTPMAISDLPAILKKLDIAKKAGMIPFDCAPRNYRGSFLVDLGSTITWPHPRWSNYQYTWFHGRPLESVSRWMINEM